MSDEKMGCEAGMRVRACVRLRWEGPSRGSDQSCSLELIAVMPKSRTSRQRHKRGSDATDRHSRFT